MSKPETKYVLSYVNSGDDTQDFDREFDNFVVLKGFVETYSPNWTSYQIIVTKVDS